MTNKRKYNNPEYTIIYFDENDIITTSGINAGSLNDNDLNAFSNGGDVPFSDLK